MELCDAEEDETLNLKRRLAGNSADDEKHKTVENENDRSLNLIMKSMLNEEKWEVTFNLNDTEVSVGTEANKDAHKIQSSKRKPVKKCKSMRKVRYECGLCKKEFMKKDRLTYHLRVHTDERPFKCDDCPLSFRTKGNLTIHQRVHSQETPYSCQYCNKSFKQCSVLNSHLLTHTNHRKFHCDICKQKFRFKNKITHSRIHTGEKPFSCNFCDLSFTKKVNLTKHILTHTGEKSFFCDYCSFSFRQKHHLTRHLKICTCKSSTDVS